MLATLLAVLVLFGPVALPRHTCDAQLVTPVDMACRWSLIVVEDGEVVGAKWLPTPGGF